MKKTIAKENREKKWNMYYTHDSDIFFLFVSIDISYETTLFLLQKIISSNTYSM